MASRKLYMREWRKTNPNYNNGNPAQRYCKECNVEVGKGKHRCPECMIIHTRSLARANYKRNPEIAENSRRWREANPDKVKEYAEITKQRRIDNYVQRHCKECNVEIGKMKRYCPECLSIKQGEQKKRHNLEQTEYRKERYDNRDKDAYNAYAREYQRGTKFRAYMREYQRSNRERINKYHRDRYQNDYEYRERMKHNWRKAYHRKKQNWYQLRLERIDKLKVYLEENK